MIAFSGKIHFQFTLLLWVMFQFTCFQDHFFNPIPILIASVFPDCDCKSAPMGKILPLWLLFNHRGFTHTIPGLAIFSSIVGGFFGWENGILFGIGYLLHLAMDSSTPMAIKWWKGHKKRAYR